ncbi:MAG: hypothetical protein EOO09_16740 [Chitinophagaceae bacterium]|nr:MAG: hypothetical protein EOO09_16740 [Chitinophagaceae bacterium]
MAISIRFFTVAVSLLTLSFIPALLYAQPDSSGTTPSVTPQPLVGLHPSARSLMAPKISLGFTHYAGSFITTDPKAEYVRDGYASFSELALMVSAKGNRPWHATHNFPSWGFALIHGQTGSREYIGKMTAAYAFLDLPLLRRSRYRLSLKAGAGPGIIGKPYDVYSNPKNTMIGTRLNVFINAVLKNEFLVTDRLSLNAGIGFMHLSNGGTTLPNLGLNTPGISAGLRYAFSPEEWTTLKPAREPFQPAFLLQVQSSAGIRQASWVGGNHYLINLVQGEAGKRTAPNHYFGAGLQLVYNRSLDYHPSDTPAETVSREKFQAGIYAAYEHHFGKLSFPFQVGFYLYNKNNYPVIFQQYGARLAFSGNWNCFAMLKSHLGKADFIHAGIGYKFWR